MGVTDAALKKKMIAEASATIELSERQACDVALLTFGGFSPLDGFMKQADYDGVVGNMRLSNGILFSLPVVLDVADTSLQGKKVLLKYNGVDMAVMEADEVWQPNKVKEAKSSYGTTSTEHPSVQELFESLGKYYVGGKVHGFMANLNEVWGGMGKAFKTPAEVRASLPAGRPVVAFQNRNPVHKAHFELLLNAKDDVKDCIVFVHPTVGPTQPGDIEGKARIKTYEGKIKGFTGIDAPYEAPENPEVHCRTDQLSVTASANKIMEKLDEAGIHLHRTFRPMPEPTDCTK